MKQLKAILTSGLFGLVLVDDNFQYLKPTDVPLHRDISKQRFASLEITP